MIILLLGGARSGKSALAERVASRCRQPVVYVAPTLVGEDADFEERIRLHRNRRPTQWATAEPGADLEEYLVAAGPGTQLIDSLGSWVAACENFAVDADGLCEAIRCYDGDVVIVSEEVGLGVHPSSALGGRFRDVLGTLNQRVATLSDDVRLVVAGLTLQLSGSPLADDDSRGA
jgi:adenosylcobinamide kinase/adenosylcobinamide-phosphate guanylyltransferase